MEKVTELWKKEICDWYMKMFSNKTLSFWCKLLTTYHASTERYIMIDDDDNIYTNKDTHWFSADHFDKFYKIIWHPLTRLDFLKEYNKLWLTPPYTLEHELIKRDMIRWSIYDWVEDEFLFKLLRNIKYEFKTLNVKN